MAGHDPEHQRRSDSSPTAQLLTPTEGIDADQRCEEHEQGGETEDPGIQPEGGVEAVMEDVAQGSPVEVGVLKEEDIRRKPPEVLRLEVGKRDEVVAVKGLSQSRRVNDCNQHESEQKAGLRSK